MLNSVREAMADTFALKSSFNSGLLVQAACPCVCLQTEARAVLAWFDEYRSKAAEYPAMSYVGQSLGSCREGVRSLRL